MIIQFWLFTARAVTPSNDSLSQLKGLFQKHSVFGDIKKDYIAIDFFKIAQEYVLLNFFTTKEELESLIDYVGRKFIAEIELEK